MTVTRNCFTTAKCDVNNCLTNIDLNVGDFNQQVNLRLAAAHPGFCCRDPFHSRSQHQHVPLLCKMFYTRVSYECCWCTFRGLL